MESEEWNRIYFKWQCEVTINVSWQLNIYLQFEVSDDLVPERAQEVPVTVFTKNMNTKKVSQLGAWVYLHKCDAKILLKVISWISVSKIVTMNEKSM